MKLKIMGSLETAEYLSEGATAALAEGESESVNLDRPYPNHQFHVEWEGATPTDMTVQVISKDLGTAGRSNPVSFVTEATSEDFSIVLELMKSFDIKVSAKTGGDATSKAKVHYRSWGF